MIRLPLSKTLLSVGVLAALAWRTHLHAERVLRRHQPSETIEVSQGPVHVMRGGVEEDGGSAMVLIHGSDGVGLDWLLSPLWAALTPYTRLLAYDRPGHGYSPVPVGRGVSIASNVKDLQLLLDTLGLQEVTLVGHSYGACVALAYALQQPARVRKLVLISPVGFAAPGLIRPLAYIPLIPVLEAILTRLLLLPIGRAVALIEGRRAFWPAPVPPTWHRLMLDFSRRRMQVHALASENRSMGQELAQLSEQYASLTVPTTILAGRHDRLTPPEHHARPLAERLRGATLQEFPDGGHQLHWTHTAQVADAILS